MALQSSAKATRHLHFASCQFCVHFSEFLQLEHSAKFPRGRFCRNALLSLRLCAFALNFYRHARVTEAGPRQSVESRHVLRHLVEQTFDGGKTVATSDI